MKKIYLLITFLIIFITVQSGFAAPDYIRFQGRLTDSNGRPTEGNPFVRFQIFDAPTGGTVVWGENNPFVEVNANDAGLFSADIGPFTSPDIFQNNEDLYIEVTVKGGTGQGDQILKPRQWLTNVPYSLHSRHAETATLSQNVPDGSIGENQISAGAIKSHHLDNKAVQPINISTDVTKFLIPSGMIALFDQDCPEDWDRYGALDDKFPMGVLSFSGETGGFIDASPLVIKSSGTHDHALPPHNHTTPGHEHSIGTYFACLDNSGCYDETQLTGNATNTQREDQTSTTSLEMTLNGEHTHSIETTAPFLPPYLGMVYCKKR